MRIRLLTASLLRATLAATGLAALAFAAVGVAGARDGATIQAGSATRYYQVAAPALTIATDPVYHNPLPAFSFAIDTPGRVVAIHIVPTAEIRASFEDRVVGSVWVNASAGPTIDDLFAITGSVPAMHLHKLADVGLPTTSDMPVAAGDVVTVLLGDEKSGAPPLPPATWILQVEE